jgi:hypothetical protein
MLAFFIALMSDCSIVLCSKIIYVPKDEVYFSLKFMYFLKLMLC